jgi:hypothetical protein
MIWGLYPAFFVPALVHVKSANVFQNQLPCLDVTVVLVLVGVSRDYMVGCDSSKDY